MMRYSWISKSAWETLVMCNNWILDDETVHCCWCLTMCHFLLCFEKRKQQQQIFDGVEINCFSFATKYFGMLFIYILKPSIAINMLPFFFVSLCSHPRHANIHNGCWGCLFLLANHGKLRKVWRSFWFVMRLKSVIQTVTTSRAWWIKIEENFSVNSFWPTHTDIQRVRSYCEHIQNFSLTAFPARIYIFSNINFIFMLPKITLRFHYFDICLKWNGKCGTV